MRNFLTYALLVILLLVVCLKASGQEDCVVKLNEAEKLYEEGKIEKIPEILSGCIQSGFNKENKIQALRLVTIVHLFEDNQQKAEKTLLQLLKTEPEYKVNRSVDPIEFINLFKSFNTAPVFSAGVSMGTNFTRPHLLVPYSRNAFRQAQPEYKSGSPGLTFALKFSWHINSFWDLSFEPNLSLLSYELTENVGNTIGFNEEVNQITLEASESMNFIEFPVYGTYYFYNWGNYQFFAEAGVSYGLYLSGSFDGVVYQNATNTDFEGSNIDTNPIRRDYNLMTCLGAGTKIKLNRSNIQLHMRYNIGFNNMVETAMRYSDHEGINTDYLFIDNDFSLNRFSIMLSYNWEFYIHKKKPDNQSNYEIIR